MSRNVFITGGTGYLGKRLIGLLLNDGYAVTALVRKGSEHKLPVGCDHVVADPFDEHSFATAISPDSIFVQLLGVPHPSPSKKEQFKTIDLASVKASAKAAVEAKAAHFVYVSVAQTPTKVMYDYQLCRAEGEATLKETGIPVTFIRPWYIIGPGHYWPLIFLPLFKLAELFPATAPKAKALRLVYLQHMLRTLLFVIKNPPQDNLRVLEIAQIREM